MAVFNEMLAGRFNRAVQKLFSMKGPPPVPQLGSEILPVHAFLSGMENRYLEGWQRYAFAFTVGAGGAGNFSVVQITNPAGSNMVIVLEKIVFSNLTAAASRITMGYQANGLADLANVQNLGNIGLDFRGQPAPILRATFKNNTAVAGGGTTILSAVVNANFFLDYVITENQELVVLPTSSYSFAFGTANAELDVSLLWRERALEESERF